MSIEGAGRATIDTEAVFALFRTLTQSDEREALTGIRGAGGLVVGAIRVWDEVSAAVCLLRALDAEALFSGRIEAESLGNAAFSDAREPRGAVVSCLAGLACAATMHLD
jgi:hypothetical protein